MKYDASTKEYVLHTGMRMGFKVLTGFGTDKSGEVAFDGSFPEFLKREERHEIASFMARKWLAWGCPSWLRGEPMVADLPDGSKPPEGFDSWERFGKYADLARTAEELKGMMIDRNPLQQQYIFECLIKDAIAPGMYDFPSPMGMYVQPYRIWGFFFNLPSGATAEVQVCSDSDQAWVPATPDKGAVISGKPTYVGFNIMARYTRLHVILPDGGQRMPIRVDVGRGYSLEEIFEAHKKWAAAQEA